MSTTQRTGSTYRGARQGQLNAWQIIKTYPRSAWPMIHQEYVSDLIVAQSVECPDPSHVAYLDVIVDTLADAIAVNR